MAERSTDQVALELPPQAEFVGVARMVVATFARHQAFLEDQIDDLRIAVSEAVTNAVRAHLGAGVDEPVSLTAAMEGDALVVEVVDRGNGFDPGAPFGADGVAGAADLEGGLGLTVIRSLFTETVIEPVPEGGMRLRITAKREGRPEALG